MTDLKVGFCPADATNFTELPMIQVQSDIETNAESIKSTFGPDIFSDNGVCTQFDKSAKVFKYYVDPSKVKPSNVPAAEASTAADAPDAGTATDAPADASATVAGNMFASAYESTTAFLSDNWPWLILGAVGVSIVAGIRQAYKSMNADPNAAPKDVKKPSPEVAKKASKKELAEARAALGEGKLPTYDILIQLLDGNNFKGDKVSPSSLAPDEIAKRDQVRFNALTEMLANTPKTEALAEALLEKWAEIATKLDPQKGKSSETVMMEALKAMLAGSSVNEADIKSNLAAQVDHVVSGAQAQPVNVPKLDLPATFDELKAKAKISESDDFGKQYEKIKLSVRGNKALTVILEQHEKYLRENLKALGSNFNVPRAIVKALEVSLAGDRVHFEEALEFEVRGQHLAALDTKRLSNETLQKHADEIKRQREEIERRRAAIEAERAKRVAP